MSEIPPLRIIGELMNNSYARARRAWESRDTVGYQYLARLQDELGASFLTLNLDGTRKLAVNLQEMLEFLPRVITALQEVTDLPISFDNPNAKFHRVALETYDRSRARGRPILNSLAVSRDSLGEMIELAAEKNMDVIVMASEYRDKTGAIQAADSPDRIHEATHYFAGQLRDRAEFSPDRIIVDPGLCPLASDIAGGVNRCLDAIRRIRQDPDLFGIHISVGLSNFSIGAPPSARIPLERAMLTLAIEAGLDTALANPEKNTAPLAPDDPWLARLRMILQAGRVGDGESPEEVGFRQLESFMEHTSNLE